MSDVYRLRLEWEHEDRGLYAVRYDGGHLLLIAEYHFGCRGWRGEIHGREYCKPDWYGSLRQAQEWCERALASHPDWLASWSDQHRRRADHIDAMAAALRDLTPERSQWAQQATGEVA
jgi:hypothetical protein